MNYYQKAEYIINGENLIDNEPRSYSTLFRNQIMYSQDMDRDSQAIPHHPVESQATVTICF